jgi:gluconolactonase
MAVKKSLLLFLLVIIMAVLIFCSPAISDEKGSDIIAPGATIKKVQSGFTFTEGPAADAEGNIYFTDIPTEKIFKWSYKDGSITLYREGTGQANGLMFDGKGQLIVCEMGNNRVTLDDLKGNISVLADHYKGKKLNMPNDLWIDPGGGIYFSDFLGPGSAESQNEKLQIYYIPPDNRELIRVTEDLVAPNGLIGTPDGKTLYIADMGVRKTLVYKIQPDGSLTDKKIFCNEGHDGMALDEKGHVYVTGDTAIHVYNPKGEKIEEIAFPDRPANVSFGGKERKTLFITAMTSVYTLEMAVRGALTPLDQARSN